MLGQCLFVMALHDGVEENGWCKLTLMTRANLALRVSAEDFLAFLDAAGAIVNW